jgi:PRC-barrel domain protein
MKYTFGASVAVLALGVSGHAIAACPDDISKLRTDLQHNQSFQQRYTAGKIDRASYMRLLEAAQTFSTMGLERRCQDVLSGIREVADKIEAEAPATPPRTEPPRTAQPTPPQADRREPRSADRGSPETRQPRADRTDDRAARLSAAKPITGESVSFENLKGVDVRNLRNDDLGDVEDFIVERGQITTVVIARGGFLGMGVHYHKIPVNQVKVAHLSDNVRDKKSRVLVLDLSDEQVKALPRVTKESGQWVAADDDRRPAPDRRTSPPERAPSAPPTQPDGRPRQ